MKQITLIAQERTETGKQATKALRRAGRVPITLYGPSVAPRSLSVERRTLEKIVHSLSTALIAVEIEGQEMVRTLLKAHQADRVRGGLVHADLYHVRDDHRLHTVIPVEVTGNSEGVKAGGILERAIREVEIECFPRDLPEHLTVDVTALDIGDSIHVRDLDLPERVTIRSPEPSTTLVHVVMPRVAVEAEPTEEEALAAAEAAAETPGEEGAKTTTPSEGGGEG